MSSKPSVVPYLFEISDFSLTVPNAPQFTELAYSVCAVRSGKPETFNQTKWFSPAVSSLDAMTLAPSTAWSATASSVEGPSTIGTDKLQFSTIVWGKTNTMRLMVDLKLTMPEGAGDTIRVVGQRFISKSTHPLVVSVLVSPRHPSMGITKAHSSTREWSTLVSVDVSEVANQPKEYLDYEFALTTAARGDAQASAKVMKDVRLKFRLSGIEFRGALTVAPPLPWPNYVSQFPYVFILDQFVLTGRVTSDKARGSGEGATTQIIMPSHVTVDVVRKHDEGGLGRRLSSTSRVASIGSIPQLQSTDLVTIADTHTVMSLSEAQLEALSVDPPPSRYSSESNQLGAKRGKVRAQCARRGDARTDGDSILLVDDAIPNSWIDELFAGNRSLHSPKEEGCGTLLRMVKLHLETDEKMGSLIPRESKRSLLAFSYSTRKSEDAPAEGPIVAEQPLNCSTQLFGFENFPETGLVLSFQFPKCIELHLRVRRFLIEKYAKTLGAPSERAVSREDLC